MTIGVVSGDDVLETLREGPDHEFRNLDTDEPLSTVSDRLVTANAYIGARPIAEALDRGRAWS